jgi:serine O-acetyltransferase
VSGSLLADARRYASAGERVTLVRALRLLRYNYGLRALVAYRLGRSLLRNQRRIYLWPLLALGWLTYYLLSRYVRITYDIRLELTADIEPGLYIAHFGNIHLRHCRLGRSCSIAHSVHILPAAAGERPTIGDRVWIGPHARIVGPWRIGSGSTVSAGAVVLRDIPERTLCLGDPARLVNRGYDNQRILAGV